MDELYRSENLVVRRVPAQDQSRWVVTFDNYSIGHGFDREGFGEAFLKQYGVSAIHVMGVREDWYQYPDMEAALEAVRAATTGARVMTYGSSMGAYAAIRFADRVGAQAALALSPQYSVDPRKAPFEKRWPADGRRIQWRAELDGPIRCSIRPTIVYDPASDDRLHRDLIAGDISLEEVALPYSGHPAATYLMETGLLTSLVFGVLEGTADARTFRREGRRRRTTSTAYLCSLSERQPGSRQATAIALARRALAQSPTSAIAAVTLARHLTAAGLHEEAVALHRRNVEMTDRYFIYLVAYADALIAAGDAASALEIALEVMSGEEAQRMAHLNGWLGLIAWAAGERARATTAMSKAVDLDPTNMEYRRLLREYRHGAGGVRARASALLERTRAWFENQRDSGDASPDNRAAG